MIPGTQNIVVGAVVSIARPFGFFYLPIGHKIWLSFPVSHTGYWVEKSWSYDHLVQDMMLWTCTIGWGTGSISGEGNILVVANPAHEEFG